LYLRRVRFEDGYHYVIRESYRDGGCWKCKDLADLGMNPGEYIEYAGGNGFYFNADLEEKLGAECAGYSTEDLEGLFLPFLKPRIRRIIESFQTHTTRSQCSKTISERELAQGQRGLHSFDKRRLHFLRFGRVNIGDLDQRPWKFLKVLLEKSRDEIEHTLEGMERALPPHEVRLYLFAALHLQTCFPHHLLRNHPAGLDPEAVDNCLLAALCSLNADNTFFAGMDGHDPNTLHPYLKKYLILYFDAEDERRRWPESIEEFVRRQQSFRRPPPVQRMEIESACRVLGISREDVAGMDREELVRLYRSKAKDLHPDRGGDKESFIRMAEAFACILEQK
jgi:hypothetical protein